MSVVKKVFLFLVDAAQTILLAGSVFLVIYVFLFRPYEVSGASMYPTFEDKEYVLTNLIGLRFGDPKRGDVIVFKSPEDPEKDFIKRVIAVEGDTVSIQDGEVLINGVALDQSAFLSPEVETYSGSFLQDGQNVTIGPGEFFVMGDNRPHSSDSREWGMVKRTQIIGKSVFVYWPPNHARLVKNPYQ